MKPNKSAKAAITLLTTTKTALLIIDKQLGYTARPALGNRAAVPTTKLKAMLPRLDNFIRQARNYRVPMVWTRMVENVDESPPNIRFKIANDDGVAITRTSDDTFTITGEQPQGAEKVLTKYHYDAFSGTDLHEYLQMSGVQTIILTGAYSSRCVLATAFAGHGLGYNIILVEDLIANPDDFDAEQQAALSIMRTILGFVIDSATVLDGWASKATPMT